MPSDGRAATPLPSVRHLSQALRTDSCQTHPLSRHACATRSIVTRYAPSRSDACSASARACTSARLAVIRATADVTIPPSSRLMSARCTDGQRCAERVAAAAWIPIRAEIRCGRAALSRNGRAGQCRSGKATARTAMNANAGSHRDSHLRHARDEGGHDGACLQLEQVTGHEDPAAIARPVVRPHFNLVGVVSISNAEQKWLAPATELSEWTAAAAGRQGSGSVRSCLPPSCLPQSP